MLSDRSGEVYEFTSKLFFEEATSDRVFTQAAVRGEGRGRHAERE